MNNEFEQHKTKDKIKWIMTLIAFIIVGVMFVGVIFSMTIIKAKIDKPTEDTEQTSVDTTDNTIISIDENHGGIKLAKAALTSAQYDEYGISPQAESAFTITATVYPASAVAMLDWSVEFKNANSSWAKGKNVTDYFTVTATADGALTANAECLKAFGEQIILKAAARDDDTVFATCTVDYAQRLTDVSIVGKLTETSNDPEYGGKYKISKGATDNVIDGVSILPLYSADTSYWRDFNESAEFDYIYGEGTVKSSVLKKKVEVKASAEFLKVYDTGSYRNGAGACPMEDWEEFTDWVTKDGKFNYASVLNLLGKSFPLFDPEYGSPNSYGLIDFYKGLKTYDSVDYYVRVTATVQCGDNQIDQVLEMPCKFDRNSSVFKASSISFDKSNFVC